jgi:hypothetical protein
MVVLSAMRKLRRPPETLYAVVRLDGSLAGVRTERVSAEGTANLGNKQRWRGFPFRVVEYVPWPGPMSKERAHG